MDYKWSDRLRSLEGNAIREIFKLLKNPEVISFAGGLPAKEGIPTDIVRRITDDLLRDKLGYDILQYGATEGWAPFVESGIEYLKGMGLTDLSPSQVLPVSGGQQGIDLTFKAFINKGDAILFEKPTYLAALHIAKTYEAKLVAVESEDDGIDLDDLENKIAENFPKILYIVPTFSNPTGKTLSLEKRREIARITAKYGVIVIEDDPYSRIRFSGESLPPIKSFDMRGNIIYLTSFSKTVAPGIRVGLVAADENIIRKLAVGKQASDVHTTNLSQAIVDRYLRGNYMEDNLKKVRPIYKEKKDYMIECIEKYFPSSIKHTDPDGGLFIWCELPEGIDAAALLPDAINKNVAYVAGRDFFADGSGSNTFRLNYSNASREQIEKGIKALGELFRENNVK